MEGPRPRRRRSRAALLVAGLGLVAAAGNVRLTPPAVAPPSAAFEAEPLPAWCEVVDLPVDEGPTLRALHVASDPGAPVVIHLLGSGESPTTPLPAARQLSDMGIASLVVAYSGIRPSDGERSPRHLARDARAAWRAALRLTGGREDLVLLRGTSLGTLACAALLEQGARPAGIVLLAPVRAETVVEHFAVWKRGELAGLLASWIFATPLEVDLLGAIRRAGVPVLAYVPSSDPLLPRAERLGLGRACEASGGRMEVRDDADHVGLSRRRRLVPGEQEFFRAGLGVPLPVVDRLPGVLEELPAGVAARFPEGSAERRRLAALAAARLHVAPEHLAAGALAGLRGEELKLLDAPAFGRWIGDLPFDDRVAVLDLSDPSGRLPCADVLRAAASDEGAALARRGPRAVLDAFAPADPRAWRFPSELDARAFETKGKLQFVYAEKRGEVRSGACFDPREAAAAPPDASPSDVARRLARIRLKGAGIPERVRELSAEEGGGWVLEAREGGEWRVLDLAPLTALLEAAAT